MYSGQKSLPKCHVNITIEKMHLGNEVAFADLLHTQWMKGQGPSLLCGKMHVKHLLAVHERTIPPASMPAGRCCEKNRTDVFCNALHVMQQKNQSRHHITKLPLPMGHRPWIHTSQDITRVQGRCLVRVWMTSRVCTDYTKSISAKIFSKKQSTL